MTTATVAKTSRVRYSTWTWSYGALDTEALSRIDWLGVCQGKRGLIECRKAHGARGKSVSTSTSRRASKTAGRMRTRLRRSPPAPSTRSAPAMAKPGRRADIDRRHLVWASRRPAIPQGTRRADLRPAAQRSQAARHQRPLEIAKSPAGENPERLRHPAIDRFGWCGGEELNLHVLADTSS